MATKRGNKKQGNQNGGNRVSGSGQAKKKDLILIAVLSVMIVAILAGGWMLIDSLLNPGGDDTIVDNNGGGLSDLFGDKPEEDPATMTFYTGVYVDDVSLGGMTMAEARTALETAMKDKLAGMDVTVMFEDKVSGTFKVTDDMVTSDLESVLQQAMNVGRTGEESNLKTYIEELPNNPVKLTTTLTVDASSKETEVKALADSLTVAPVDAAFVNFDATKPEGERFTFSEDQPGLTVDPEKLWADVKKELENREDGIVEAVGTETPASVTLEDVQANYTQICSFSSNLTKDKKRNNNVTLASQAISGLVMKPGDEFSFNGVVGERTRERGYMEAGVIVGGDRTEAGLGGGICQVSGTLFNAVVMADLEITERYTHSYELSYLKRGRDATVDYGNKDFKFKNNKNQPIILVMMVDTDKLTVTAQIYGPALPDGLHIDIEVETTARISPAEGIKYEAYNKQEPGSTTEVKARSGIRCTSYKIWLDANNKEVRREELYKDYYPPIQAKVYYNPKDGDPSLSPSPSPTVSPTPTPETTPTVAPVDPTPVPTEKPADPTPVPTEKPADPTPEPVTPPEDDPVIVPDPGSEGE